MVTNANWEVCQRQFPDIFESYKKFESQAKKFGKKSDDIAESIKVIDEAINNALTGQKYNLVIILDDPLVDKEKYKMILNKFYAVIRYDLYHQIKKYAD